MKNRLLTKKLLIPSIVGVSIMGVTAATVVHRNARQTNKPATVTTKNGGTINYSPPTAEEKAASEANKDAVVKRTELENQSSNTSSKKTATPIITSVDVHNGQITASTMITGIFEDGGTCTFTFSQGSNRLTKTTTAFASATTTSCTVLTLNRSEFAQAGSWQLVVGYSSDTAQGTSSSKMVDIP